MYFKEPNAFFFITRETEEENESRPPPKNERWRILSVDEGKPKISLDNTDENLSILLQFYRNFKLKHDSTLT